MDDIVSVDELANFLEITTRTVHHLVNEGYLPRATRGKYEFRACVQSYIRYQRKKAVGGGSVSLTEEKTRLTNLQADKIDLELQQTRGELVDRIEILKVLDKMNLQFRSRLLSRNVKMAPVLFGCESLIELKTELEESDHECLAEFASLDPESVPDILAIEPKAPTAPKIDDQPMGRSKKKVKPGSKLGAGKMGYRPS